MFDNTSDQFIKQNNMIGTLRPRSCWSESTFLETLINCLPQLEHLCFFADVSDDPTLVLLFSKLIPIPSSYLSPPAPTSLDSLSSSHLHHAPPRHIHKPFSLRLRSFSWRLRAPPPSTFRKFARSSTFVSIHHLVRHTPNLDFLVLDADMDYTASPDILAVLEQLAERDKWAESRPPKLSLMLCGPILGWGDIFLKNLVKAYSNIKELFIDRPLTSPLVLDQVGALDFLVRRRLSMYSTLVSCAYAITFFDRLETSYPSLPSLIFKSSRLEATKFPPTVIHNVSFMSPVFCPGTYPAYASLGRWIHLGRLYGEEYGQKPCAQQ